VRGGAHGTRSHRAYARKILECLAIVDDRHAFRYPAFHHGLLEEQLGSLVGHLERMEIQRQPTYAPDTASHTNRDAPRQSAIVANVPPSPTESNEASQRHEHVTPGWKIAIEFAAIAVAFGLLVANIFQTRATQKAADSAKSAADTARASLVSVQRAFVTFSTAINYFGNVDPRTHKIVTWGFSVPITRGMRMRARVYPSDIVLPDNFDFPDVAEQKTANIVLGPRQTTWTDQFGNVSPATINGVKLYRTKHLYLYGWATYRDVFDNTPLHVTKFCYDLKNFGPDPFTGSGPANTFYAACPRHNCTDEECDQEPTKSPP
jgi:hypothetical protein